MAAFSAFCFCLALLLMWQRRSWRRTQSVLLLFAGAGIAGQVGAIRQNLINYGTVQGEQLTGRMFGVGLVYAFALLIVGLWILQMDIDGYVNKMRKNGKGSGKYSTTAYTPWLGLMVLPLLGLIPFIGGFAPELNDAVNELALMFMGANT